MKPTTQTMLYLQVAAMIVATALAGPAAAGKAVPFVGSIETVDTGCTVEGEILRCVQTGTGTASHVGRFTLDWVIEINLTTGTASGTYVFTSANEDELRTTFTGEHFATDDPAIAHIVEEHTIVGGTGRSAGATGSFVHDDLANESLALPITVGTLEGTISF